MSLKSSYSTEGILECGCDEAGRGCLAGPLFAAAVIFPPNYHHSKLNDSKQLSKKERKQLREVITKEAIAYAVAQISVETIDQINILNAAFKGMNEAVKRLTVVPELLLIDGNQFKNETDIPYRCIVKGDAQYLSIAAASILAKTFRDDYMDIIDKEYPHYGWKENKGYATAVHQNALLQYGRSPYHRKSFHVKGQLKIPFG